MVRTDQSASARPTPGDLFLSELGLIERVIDWVCRRHRLWGADAQDFHSTVKLRLIERDYEILAKFEGRCSLRTYLTVVINRLCLDYQAQRFGKWRASAAARRLGPLAVRLEALLYRDGLTLDEARGMLQSQLPVAASADELYELSRKLPPRTRRRPHEHDPEEPPGGEPVQAAKGTCVLEKAERQRLADRIFEALGRALRTLPGHDRTLLRLNLEDGFPIADIARVLGEDQRTLYRRKTAIVERLRAELGAEGICHKDGHELLSILDWDAALT
jgi:RNA polymerase sigma factor for flagellar operon FliA